ncbi:MAG: hypothetical protein E7678_02570 [Ruminococcaceae bacterium]|nr:hypothetical protein [Oscillospiraceae bacterium]
MSTIKKILTVLVLSVLVLSLTVPTFAADTGSFVQSPSANQAPELVFGGSEEHECDEPLRIVSYLDRDKLDDEARKEIEKAYSKIKNAKNLVTLCSALQDVAKDMKIPTTNLAVSDLFDISDVHGHVDGTFDIVLKAETLDNFVGLLHYTDGKWELIDNAKVEERDGELHLMFSTDGLSPFAIVVDTHENVPTQSNGVLIAVLAVIAIAEAAALIAILVKFILSKKLG